MPGGGGCGGSFTGVFDAIKSLLATIKNDTNTQIVEFRSFRAQIENEILSLKENLTNLHMTLNNLSLCLREHKECTKAELNRIHTSQNKHAHCIHDKLEALNLTLKAQDEKLSESINNLSLSFYEYTLQSREKVDHIQTYLISKLNSLSNATADLTSDHQQTQANTSGMECVDTEQNLQLHQNMQDNLTRQMKTITKYMESLPVHMCGGTRGWTRIAYLNMSDPNTACPSGWQLTGNSNQTCGKVSTNYKTCDSTTFAISREYSRICGRVRAYQWGAVAAFWYYHTVSNIKNITINEYYADGVSITHGTPQARSHIWTFVAGAAEDNPTETWVCPCDATINIRVPPFVGENYFCEAGVNEQWKWLAHHKLFPNDTLWDGEDCLSSSTCCSRRNPPYFLRQLPNSTTDNIEARICLFDPSHVSNVAVELIELYVQ